MTTSELITDYKNKLALKLVNTEGLVEAMGNDDIEEPDEAIYTYIFPYFHIPDTIEAANVNALVIKFTREKEFAI